MTEILAKIEYKNIFHFFEEISAIPRGSKNNEAISNYLVKFAKDRNLKVIQDENLNVIIIKEATKGYEHCPAVILQGHMDMVCIKEIGSNHDFMKDGLDLVIDGDFIEAKGTTLGGDNGIAIAYALAILDSNDIIHPRLEVIITTDEEIGLLGATALDTKELTAKYMFNLDSEEESSILVGCAGGMTSICELPVKYEQKTGSCVEVGIIGLQGGHSGCDITKHRTNATRLLVRFLMELSTKYHFSVVGMHGGQKDNAIPSEAKVEFVIEQTSVKEFIEEVKRLEQIYKEELVVSEPNLEFMVQEKEHNSFEVLTEESLKNVMAFIQYQPDGIQNMSADIEGLVESSLNLGIFHMDNEKAVFSYSVRSSVATYKQFLSDKLEWFTKFLGGSYRFEGEYPEWAYRHESELRDLMIEIYREEFKREPIIEAIHAGLECGILSHKMPELDIVSIGPDMMDVHTPKERLSISSTKRVFDYVVKVLEALCEKHR